MEPKVFVDTDVIIDFLTERSPFAQSSALIFELNEKKTIKIYISSLSVNNVYYVSRKLLGAKKARALIRSLVENLEVLGTSKKVLMQAIDSNFRDFEDALQHSTALTVKNLDAIVTRNVKDYKKAVVAVFTPEVFVKTRNSF